MRITESLAKLALSPVATEEHVDEAIRLFLCSTMDAVNQGSNQGSRALMILQRRDTIMFRNQGAQVYRNGA